MQRTKILVRSFIQIACVGVFIWAAVPLAVGGGAPDADAATLFKSKCAMCHGTDGAGKTPMGAKLGLRPMSDAEVQKQTDDQLFQVISKGRNKMQPYEGKLSLGEINSLVAFVRGLAKNQ